MYLDKLDNLHLSINKDWEPFQTNIIEKLVKKGEVVFDIGANIGFYTLLFSKLVGENGKVYAFEPDPETFSLLKRNIGENNINNVVLINKAVSNKEEKIDFYILESNTSGNSVFKENLDKVASKSIKVDSVSLDEFFGKNFKVDFVKLDIEGSELKALQGMSKILKNSKNPTLVTEFCPVALNAVSKDINANAKTYLELLNSLGFKIFDIDDRIKKITSREIDDLM